MKPALGEGPPGSEIHSAEEMIGVEHSQEEAGGRGKAKERRGVETHSLLKSSLD